MSFRLHTTGIVYAIVAAASLGLNVPAALAQSVEIDFSFTTQSGVTGSFTLDPNTPAASEPSFGVGQPGLEGILYPGAVSNFSLSGLTSPSDSITTDYELIPGFTSDFLPSLPDGTTGILSGAVFPTGCSATVNVFCSATVGVLYTGELAEPPKLSSDPASYPIVLIVETFSPETGMLQRDLVTSFEVTPRTVSEPTTNATLIGLGIIGADILRRRFSN
ncbi:MAG: hypothetical protein VKK42_24880 [Lyngbya sp.]|nr:hypothetical protein [Lyngbya sp.]